MMYIFSAILTSVKSPNPRHLCYIKNGESETTYSIQTPYKRFFNPFSPGKLYCCAASAWAFLALLLKNGNIISTSTLCRDTKICTQSQTLLNMNKVVVTSFFR